MTDPSTERAIDPEEFLGDPVAGDANADSYLSNDQSAAATEVTGTADGIDGDDTQQEAEAEDQV